MPHEISANLNPAKVRRIQQMMNRKVDRSRNAVWREAKNIHQELDSRIEVYYNTKIPKPGFQEPLRDKNWQENLDRWMKDRTGVKRITNNEWKVGIFGKNSYEYQLILRHEFGAKIPVTPAIQAFWFANFGRYISNQTTHIVITELSIFRDVLNHLTTGRIFKP